MLQASTVAMASCLAPSLKGQLSQSSMKPDYVAKGPIRHSVMGWCFNPMSPAELARQGKQMGLSAIEGIPASAYAEVKAMGLDISLVSGGHGFAQGPCNPAYTDQVVVGLTKAIDLASSVGANKVITFTGMRYEGMDDEAAVQLCLNTWKKVLLHAERKKVTLVLEHLNSRDGSHPMKGHPGYFGDHVDFCIQLVESLASPYFKLLFDIYHVSVMHGDVIRRIRRYHPLIGHYHTAGNPGRGELDDNQEINYPAIMREILRTGYEGYVAHEFIPTWKDPLQSLRHGIQVCDQQL
jgi:hydroxypyruvate isomerase